MYFPIVAPSYQTTAFSKNSCVGVEGDVDKVVRGDWSHVGELHALSVSKGQSLHLIVELLLPSPIHKECSIEEHPIADGRVDTMLRSQTPQYPEDLLSLALFLCLQGSLDRLADGDPLSMGLTGRLPGDLRFETLDLFVLIHDLLEDEIYLTPEGLHTQLHLPVQVSQEML